MLMMHAQRDGDVSASMMQTRLVLRSTNTSTEHTGDTAQVHKDVVWPAGEAEQKAFLNSKTFKYGARPEGVEWYVKTDL
jgi:hypothetical protein